MSAPAPPAAVVLVDVDEWPVSPTTFEAAAAAAERVGAEIVVVETRSTTGRAWLGASATVVSPDGPQTPTELRLAGVAATLAPIIAFLDGRAVPSADWLEVACARLAADPQLAALSPDAPGIGEPTLSYRGNVGARHPTSGRGGHVVLAPHPEAAVFRRAELDRAPAWLRELSWPCAVISLGWQAALRGARVEVDPTASVAGRCTCEPDAYGGLVTLHAHLGEEALASVLPAAAAATALDDGGQADLDRFLERLPELVARRDEVQAARVVDEEALLGRLVGALEPPRGLEDQAAAHEAIAARHRLHELFDRRFRVLIVTPDILTTRMAGPAIRAWQIAEALAERHLVTLASTASQCEVSSDRFEVVAPDDHTLRRIAKDVDVVVLQGFALEGRPYLAAEDKVVVVDLYDPLHLEQLELFRHDHEEKRRVTVREATRVLNEQLVRGDFFLCASSKQRDFWLGQLAGVGRVNHRTYDDDHRLARLLSIVPFGLPDDPPTKRGPAMKGVVDGIGPGDDVVLWGGGIYNWFDPLTLLRAVASLRSRRPNLRLFFMGLKHPNPEVEEMRIATESRRLAAQLRLTDETVFFNEGWVPYDRRQDYLLEASIGVSTHFDHVETEFSFRTRILDYIWAAVPIVTTKGDWFASLVDAEGLGLTVEASDVDGLAVALDRLLGDEELVATCRANLERVRERFHWSRVLEPLTEFLRSPRRAPDLSDLETRATLWATDQARLEDFLRRQPTIPDRLRSLVAGL